MYDLDYAIILYRRCRFKSLCFHAVLLFFIYSALLWWHGNVHTSDILHRNGQPNLDGTLQAPVAEKYSRSSFQYYLIDTTVPPIEHSQDNYLAHDGEGD